MLSFGVSASGFSAGFDIFERTDSAYTPVRLFKHTVNEDVNTYTVTFVDGLTGDIISTASVNECENAVLPEAPIHDGYTFVRYDDNGEFITNDITVTAEYSVNSYLVTFIDGLTGSTLSEQVVEYGNAAAAPEAPAHEGYTFTGWDNDFESVSCSMTVAAQYARNSYTVTFLDWDGTELGSETVLHGESGMVRTCTPYSCRKTGNRVCMAASPGNQKPNSTAQNTLTGNSKSMPPMPASITIPAATQRIGVLSSSLPARRSRLQAAL